MRDPNLAQLFRWQRARGLTLAIIGFATAAVLLAQRESSPPVVEKLRAEGFLVEGAPDPERSRTAANSGSACERRYAECRGYACPKYEECVPLWPGIEISGERWIAHDLIGIAKVEIEITADPTAAEAKLRAWTRSICDGQPRPLYIRNLQSPTAFSELARIIESECSSFEVRADHRPYL